jgi:hypothetical protein
LPVVVVDRAEPLRSVMTTFVGAERLTKNVSFDSPKHRPATTLTGSVVTPGAKVSTVLPIAV